MRRMILPAVAAVLFASTMIAHAGKGVYPEEGVVQAIDESAQTITLDGDKVFHLPESWENSEVTVGYKVKITYFIQARQKLLADLEILEDN